MILFSRGLYWISKGISVSKIFGVRFGRVFAYGKLKVCGYCLRVNFAGFYGMNKDLSRLEWRFLGHDNVWSSLSVWHTTPED